ncbi:glycine--tRNA ligase subunit beta [Desulfatiglans anilini]|uniref:glycine--tRNA ligase subunit beta n=1 Tax=Desulfatiglans anilini TaxID=90728 RepID=UPI000484D8C4|nr:glycine--tRNA ligase subunit beta [Desulfatiglans anilini]
MSSEFILEIGTEEIPAGYLADGLENLRRLWEELLAKNEIGFAERPAVYGTPRRLVLRAAGVERKQRDRVQEVTGPPRQVAYDKDGRPTKAALGFAQKQGVAVEALGTISTPRGEYLHVKHAIAGRPAAEILAENLPALIAAVPWPKSMRWGSENVPFVRPIHWIVALFEGAVVPFELAGIRSGSRSAGHRFMAPEPFEVAGWERYLKDTAERFVVIDPAEREERVREQVEAAAASVGGRPSDDPELVSINANLVEYPSAVAGHFDEAFLAVPPAVLITAMREHQKYFAVYDQAGNLMPHFIAVNNTRARDERVVRRGHERVLRARLSDARFFFEEDRKRPLIERLEDLKGVIYQADLGTSYAKVQRFGRLARYLAERVLPEKTSSVETAARLCKCDLVSHMVGEFPTLQGVMGTEYARIEGYPEEVAEALGEHYLPNRAGGEMPRSKIGALVGVADRMDTITGCFAVGLEPSGSADPFALRRHALAIIRILEEFAWNISLDDLIDRSLEFLGEEIAFDRAAVFEKVQAFFMERCRQMMLRSGYVADLVEAVLSVAFDPVTRIPRRLEQLQRFVAESGDFETAAMTFKRVSNILKKTEERFKVNPALFKEPSEGALWDAIEAVRSEVIRCVEREEYYAAMQRLKELRAPVDRFFDQVEVMTKDDPALRENRIAVLQDLESLFLRVADFSKFGV